MDHVVSRLGSRMLFRVWSLGLSGYGAERFRVEGFLGLGFRVWGLGFRVVFSVCL